MSDDKVLEDEHGQYKASAGSTHPVTEEEMGYVPCNAVLKFTFERYGERRYCTAMAMRNFVDGGSQFCNNHKGRENLMKLHEERFQTGAHSKSHQHQFQYLDTHKKVMANDLYRSLLSESTYDFEEEIVEMEIDARGADFGPDDLEVIVLDHPVPTEHKIRGKALWHAAMEFMTMESIREEQFRVAAEETHEGRELAVGERETIVTVTESGREVKDVDEHHLNLPMSRIAKHYDRHLRFGGVTIESDDDDIDMSAREWTLHVAPEEEDIAPEADNESDNPPVTDIEVPDPDDVE